MEISLDYVINLFIDHMNYYINIIETRFDRTTHI